MIEKPRRWAIERRKGVERRVIGAIFDVEESFFSLRGELFVLEERIEI
jgi:hypothetical protein